MPEEFSPFKGAYIHYLISRLEWNPSYVMFGAKAKFSATIEGKNITFNPAVSTYLIYYHDFGFEDPTEGIQNWDGFCLKVRIF